MQVSVQTRDDPFDISRATVQNFDTKSSLNLVKYTMYSITNNVISNSHNSNWQRNYDEMNILKCTVTIGSVLADI
jgi:hypothetical protein